jgi:hypothetical protein
MNGEQITVSTTDPVIGRQGIEVRPPAQGRALNPVYPDKTGV